MAVIKLEVLGGMQPSANPQLIDPDKATFAKDVNLRFKDLRPAITPVTVATATPGTTLYKFANSSTFITKSGDVNFVRGPVPNDDTERTYYTGDGVPKVTDITLAVRQLGVPAPATAPTVTKTTVPTYTQDDALRALDTAPATIYNAVYKQLLWVYKGLSDAELADLSSTPNPWEYSVVRAGTLAGDSFSPTNPNDICLVSSELEYATDATNIRVPLFVRGGRFEADELLLATTLANIPSPDTTQPTAKMLTGDVIATVSEAITEALASRDAEIDVLVDKLKAEKEAFMELLNDTSSVTSAVAGVAARYYSTTEGAAALSAAINTAARRVVDTGVMNGSESTLTYATAAAAITGFISNSATGTKVVDTPEMTSWVLTNISPPGFAPEAPSTYLDVSSTYREAVNITNSLSMELGNMAMKVGDATMNRPPLATVTAILVERQAKMESIVKEMEVISLDVVTNKLKKAIDKIFSTDVIPTLPPGAFQNISSRAYVETYVTDRGEESKPSPVSITVEVDQDDTTTVVLSSIPGGRNITARRLYRSAVGTTSAAYMLQGEYPAATTTVNDSKTDEFLGEACPTFGWDEPLPDLAGLSGMPNGIMLAFTGSTLHACEPGAPYAWPAKYDIPLEYPIVGIAVAGQTAVVTTQGVPYLVTGVDSLSLSAEKIPHNQSCIAKRSMVAIGGAVVYASPDGLVLVEGFNASLITEGLMSKADWQAYNPSTIKAAEYEGRYCAFYTKASGVKGCLVFDITGGSLVDMSNGCDAVFTDKATDTMYILNGSDIKNYFPVSGTPLSLTWVSKKFTLSAFSPLAWLFVDAAFGNVTIELYRDDVLFYTKTVSSLTPVRLPPGRYKSWQIKITSNVVVTRVIVATTSQELKQVI